MDAPIDLTERRQEREPQYDGLVCACGSAWFTVQAVAIGPEGTVKSFAAPLACRDCGFVFKAGAWAAPSLEPVE